MAKHYERLSFDLSEYLTSMSFSEKKNLDLSVIILTWNSETRIEECLASTIRDLQLAGFVYEIILVDNGSVDETTQIIESFKKKYPNSIFSINLRTNMGTAYSRNLALKRVRGEFIFIIDSDIKTLSGTTSGLIDFLKNNPEAGIVAPMLVYPDGKFQKSYDKFPTIFSKLKRFFFLKSIERKEYVSNNEKRIFEVDYAISAFWAFRKEIIREIGLLDEKIFYSPEDVDYCFRIRKAGYKVFFNGGVSSVHHTQEISRGFKINKATVQHILGLIYYFRKHKYIFKKPNNIGVNFE